MAEEAEQPQGKKKLVLFAAVVLVAVSASIGGTLYFMGGSEEELADAEEVPAAVPQTAIYHNLRPAFIVNYLTGGKARYLQADLVVMARDPSVVEALVNHTPLVRSRILAYLTDLDFYELQTHEGKEAMRAGLRSLLNQTLSQQAGSDGIQTVLLNNFVMQ